MKFLNGLILVLCCVLFSCNGPDTPEAALRDFINYRFKGNFERSEVLDRTTGNLRERLEAMEENEFDEFAKVNLSPSFKLKVLLSKCEESECFLTYTLSYGMNENSDSKAALEVKKIAELHKIEDIWKVADVSELKTYIEMKNQLDIPSQEGE